jgi:hypothetical protein
MSGFNERIRALCAAFDRTESPEILREIHELEFQKRGRELDEERERKARAPAEKQQPAATNDWDAWYAAVDERVRGWFDYYFDDAYEQRKENDRRGCYFDMIAKGMADLRRQLRAEFTRAVEEQQRAFEAKLAEQREHFLASNSQATWVAWVDDRIKATFGYGRDVMLAEVKDVVEGAQRLIETKLMALEERLRAVPGKLPVAKTWLQESVTYEGEVVSYDGSLFQARKDTAQVPSGADWVCVARAGRDGLTPNARGAFNVYKKYAQLDVVEYEDASYIARRNNPGICPGDGWQLVSRSGRRGPAGERGARGGKGERGARGEDGREITGWHLERATYRAFPVYADGRMGPELNLRGLFEQFVEETGRTVE